MQLTDLDEEEKRALQAYKSACDAEGGGSLCFDVNEALQSGLWMDELPQDFKQHVDALDRVFSRCPVIKEGLTAYRGIGCLAVLGPLRNGRKLRSLSFLSASSRRSVAASFVKPQFSGSAGAILTLCLPIGTPAYDMETLDGAGGSEREILLPRGLLWEIEAAEKGDISDAPPQSRKDLVSLGLITLRAHSPTGRPLS